MTGFDFQKVLGMDTSINATKLYFPDLTDVLPNKLNYYSKTNDRISDLADEIESDGLREACVAYLDENENYILLSGETRYRSCMELVKQGRSYSFHGKDITGQLPIVLDQKPENTHFERLAITGSNNKRNSLSNSEKEEMIKNTIEDLNALAAMNKFNWTGRKTWEVVAAKTGLSGHYVRDYLSGKMTRNRKIADVDKDIVYDDSSHKNQKVYRDVLSSLRNADKRIKVAFQLVSEGLDPGTYLELMTATKALYEDLSALVNMNNSSRNCSECISAFLKADTEISHFVYAGDAEAITELLKSRNGTKLSHSEYTFRISNNKINFSKSNESEFSISTRRFTNMLIDYSKGFTNYYDEN